MPALFLPNVDKLASRFTHAESPPGACAGEHLFQLCSTNTLEYTLLHVSNMINIMVRRNVGGSTESMVEALVVDRSWIAAKWSRRYPLT